jgi:hypothetical protein
MEFIFGVRMQLCPEFGEGKICKFVNCRRKLEKNCADKKKKKLDIYDLETRFLFEF